MSHNSLSELKVQWDLGEGGAPKEATVRIEFLLKDYEEGGRLLTQPGFNRYVLDLEPARAEENYIPAYR